MFLNKYFYMLYISTKCRKVVSYCCLWLKLVCAARFCREKLEVAHCRNMIFESICSQVKYVCYASRNSLENLRVTYSRSMTFEKLNFRNEIPDFVYCAIMCVSICSKHLSAVLSLHDF